VSGFLDDELMMKYFKKTLRLNGLGKKNVNIQDEGNARDDPAGSDTEVKAVTYSLQALETWAGTVYLQSMIIVRVSLSLASWKGG